MGTIRVTATEKDSLSEGLLKELAALKDRPVDLSDIPEYSNEEYQQMKLLAIEKRKKQMFSLRLQTSTINWWKSLGNGYTTIMAKLLDEARKHPEWIKESIK